MSGINLRAWLLRLPHPVSVRLDGKTKVVVGDGKSRWKDLIEVINDAQAGKVECLNGDGDVLRVTRLEFADNDAQGDGSVGKKAARDDSLPVSAVIEIARLLNEAHDAGAARHAAAYESNNRFQTQMTQVLTDRLTGLENAWQQTLESRAAELLAAQPDGENADPAGQMLANVIGMAAAKASRTPTASVPAAQAAAAKAKKGKANK